MKYPPRSLVAAVLAACAAAPAAASAQPPASEPAAAPAAAPVAEIDDSTGTAEHPTGGDPSELGEVDQQKRADYLARVGEMLEGDTRKRFDDMGDSAFDELLARNQSGEELSDDDAAILDAIGAVVRQDLEGDLDFQTGEIELGADLATLRLGERMRYLAPEDARTVLVDIWGNPPDVTEPVGMLFAPGVSPLDDDAWGIVITYSTDGHVADDDADDIDFDELLSQMQSDTEAANTQRKALGYGTVELIAWAEPPHYNRATHDLYWAKELDFSDTPARTLNYSIRVLGREGVLELNAVATMDQLAMIKPEMEKALTMVSFNDGHRYEDFDAGTDRVAAYGIGGLVAGKVLAKTGFFAAAFKVLLAAKKLVIVGMLALFAGIGALVRRRREDHDDDRARFDDIASQ